MQKITIIILCIVNILLSILCYSVFKKGHQRSNTEFQSELTRKTEILERDFKVRLLNDNLRIDPNVEVMSLDKKRYPLTQILNEGPHLIVRFSERHCEECVSYILLKILRLTNVKSWNKKIILLASYQNQNALSVLMKKMAIKYPVYLIENLSIPSEEFNFPYCFILDKSMHINHVFFPDKYEFQLTNTYLELIENRYFNSDEI